MDMRELQVEKLVWRGRGLAREESGRVVMIEPGTLPGETVRVEVTSAKRDMLFARPIDIVIPSPLRRSHPCPTALVCTGCMFGVLPHRHQMTLKRDILNDALARGLPRGMDRETVPLEMFSGTTNWRYRWRAQIHVHNKKPHYVSSSGQSILLNDCLLLARPLATSMHRLAAELPEGRFSITASPSTHEASTERDPRLLDFPLPGLDVPLRLPASCFVQANWELNRDLIGLILGELKLVDRVADCYAGAGNFALPLAAHGKEVLALESSREAVRRGRETARAAGLKTVSFEAADLRQPKAWNQLQRYGPQAVVIDPPRSGSGPISRQLLSLKGLQTLVWVSCDVTNTCRDLKPFFDAGWTLTSMTMIDMFPQTWHMEVVFVLKKV